MCPRLDMYVRDKMNISRQKAQELIYSGCVYVNSITAYKPSLKVNTEDNIEISEADRVLRYAGRGGYKLEKAFDVFGISPEGCICIDIGASTGGFTDCMLRRGAKMVYSVDVGSCQLADFLRQDSRVISLENTDIRNADIEKADFISCDVSFISLKLIFPHIKRLLNENGQAVVLVKPQFEAGRSALNKKGIVKDAKIHKRVLWDIIDSAASEGLYAKAAAYSPIMGGDGNREYLLLISQKEGTISRLTAEDVVNKAFDSLKNR